MNSNAFLSVFNYRLLFILVETVIVFFLYREYQITIDFDISIVSIAIVFPLVFSITSAYQRRQEAIGLFLDFRNKIIDLTNIFFAVDKIEKKDYDLLFNKLFGIQASLINYLTKEDSNDIFEQIRQERKDVLRIIDDRKKLFNEREKDSLIRVKNELFLSAEKIRGIKLHGTPISLKKYCLIFIYFSPLLFNTQSILNKTPFDLNIESSLTLLFTLVMSFVLMALYNVQDYIENPFDQKGLDDLKIEAIMVNEDESLFDAKG
jgi:predicted membrane chloride channel (bestrophin family)